MQNIRFFSKSKLAILLIAVLILVATIGLFSPKFALQTHANTIDDFTESEDTISTSIVQDDIIDVMMADGNLGRDPNIYAAEQAEHQALANASLNSMQAYSL